MPQKDQFCGAFWGALTSRRRPPAQPGGGRATGRDDPRGGDPAGWLPPGAAPRTDYEATFPVARRGFRGTSATGVAGIEELSGASDQSSPSRARGARRRWSRSSRSPPTAPRVRPHRQFAHRAPVGIARAGGLLLDYLLGRTVEAPPPDWDCGHFLTIAACVRGPGGVLVVLRDTYPQLGLGRLPPAAGRGRGGGPRAGRRERRRGALRLRRLRPRRPSPRGWGGGLRAASLG